MDTGVPVADPCDMTDLNSVSTEEIIDRAEAAFAASEALVAEAQRRRDVSDRSRRPMASRMARRQGMVAASPTANPVPAGVRPVVAAMASAAGVPAGTELGSREQLAELTAEVLRDQLSQWRAGEGRRSALVASATWSYPENRRLGRDPVENGAIFDSICSPKAVVASGGICLPVNVDYSVPTWAVSDRPLRDGLPAFQADRGGLRYVTPPDIGVVDLQGGEASGAGSATGIWTESTDAAPGAATKPVFVIPCAAEQLVYVGAIPTRLQMGNMLGRFAPEQVAANTDVAMAAAAREQELNLLAQMYNNTKQVTPAQYLGATRDLLASVDVLSAQYRYSHRLADDQPLTAVFPSWAKALIRADMAREVGHDNSGVQNALAITDAVIMDWFDARGINVIWTLDGVQSGTYGDGGSATKNQYFGLATAGAAPQWPNQSDDGSVQIAWLLFAEGSYQFLDGGRLDLGVVRDSTLDSTNDYETFIESFEGVAFRGIEAFQVQSVVLPTGGSAGTVAVSSYHE